MKLLGKLICLFKGHKRGKYVGTSLDDKYMLYACPRCGRETRYKVKPRGTPTDGSEAI